MSRCQLMYAEPCPYAYPPFPSASSCLKFLPGCVCVSKHVYAFLSSSIFIHTYRHIHMYGLCSVLYIYPPFCFLSFVSKNLIDTYVTVPIDVRTTLPIYLSSFLHLYLPFSNSFRYTYAGICVSAGVSFDSVDSVRRFRAVHHLYASLL